MQAILPIFDAPKPACRPDPDAEAVRSRAGVEYFDLPTRSILNRCNSRQMPFTWTINPYRGCEFACTYCYARYTHSFFDLEKWEDFERKIFIKRGAATSLEKKLRRAALQGEPIAIGTATDPYQPAEKEQGVTRSLLEVFDRVEGLEISLTTKSPLILQDLDLLTRLDRKHAITVNVTITSADAGLSRQIEQHAPTPQARFRTVAKLASNGLTTRVFAMPIMPWINHSAEALHPLFQAAKEAGAYDVLASSLFLRPAARARFLPWLAEEFPELKKEYERLYRGRDYLSTPEKLKLLGPFDRLRLEYGFPQAMPGQG